MVGDYFSHGKLLLTGEYLLLRGARGLALPTSKGQHLSVAETAGATTWQSVDSQGDTWFEATISGLVVTAEGQEQVAKRLSSILRAASAQRPALADDIVGKRFLTRLDFPNDWGLGSSSTLIHLLADCFDIDAFDLLDETFGGSGYDIAVAAEGRPLIYERLDGEPYHEIVEWRPPFVDRIHFIHLGQKMDTHRAVKDFLSHAHRGYAEAPLISRLTEEMAACADLAHFEDIIRRHDTLISKTIGIESAAQVYADYDGGVCKYLGAWGGDFMLATGRAEALDFFRSLGLNTILTYDEMILKT